ncbi:MAG: DMT family transporter [Chloroflexi bacterium]|nr:MAG: DMT family transporter [Chloroflexota bacterium]MBL1193033.1 DMT family transporter [Chloroflexota bacterium]NOH10326.1 DMT family transporter [Chloroflexota bacterium]
MDAKALPYISVLGVMFGTTLLASRFSVGQFHSTTYAGLRLSIAALAHVLVYLLAVRGRQWPRDKALWWRSALLGVLGTALPMNLIILSLEFQSSGLTSILLTLGPAITVLIAHFALKDERINTRKALGVGLALSGAVLLAALGETGLPNVSQANPIGYVLVISAMIMGSAMTVYARKYMQAMDAFDVASVRMLAASLFAMPLSIAIWGFDLSQVTTQGYFALAWAAVVGTFLAMLLAFYNIQRFGASPAAMVMYIVPIVASIGGVFLLGEQITRGMLAGMSLIVVGIAILNQRARRKELPKNV